MRKFRSFAIALLTALLVLAGCRSTGEKALSRGNYYTACIQAIEKLRSSPDNAVAASTLTTAYPLLVNYVDREVDRLDVTSSDPVRYQKIFDLYSQLNNVATQVSRSPVAYQLLPNLNYYTNEMESARNSAAEETYRNAEKNMQIGTRQAAKAAHLQYVQVNSLIPGYKDVINKIQDAKWAATLKVVLEQVPVEGQYKISADFFQNQVFEYFSEKIRNEYVHIFAPEEAATMKLHPDQIIRLSFQEFVVGQVRESTDTREVKRDSVATGTYRDDQGKTHTVYGTVKAKLTVRSVELSSSGILNAFIVDYRTNTILSQQKFPGTYKWTDSWATFNGDERALSSKELNMCKRTQLSPPPPAQDMFVQFTIPIYNDLTLFIQRYYSSYK
ncbi:MAG: hypothetical protein LBS25_08760 [Candidatus Symbiothrix sp.]|jgi:hypothetical protein|nr:hypothetical protein [Candidatus Symbiothrix sp.]